MFSRLSLGLVALSFAASTFAVGCAGESGEDVASDEGAATGALLGHDYEGTIGNLKVLVRLDAQGGNVTGSYFYADKVGNGDTLVLKGTTSGAKVTLTESVNGAGATTGTFDGTVGSSGITGTWKAGNTTLPLKLTAITSLKTAIRKVKATAPKSKDEFARQCSLEADIVEVYGIDAGVEKTIGETLAVEPLALEADGTCDRDIRFVNQSVHYNGNGFLTIAIGTEYDGGAHPSSESSYLNLNLTTGRLLTGADIFAPGKELEFRALVEKQMKAEPGVTAEEAAEQISTLHDYFDAETKFEHLTIGVGQKGISFDMMNQYPRVILALAPFVEIPWADVKPLLNAEAGLASLAR